MSNYKTTYISKEEGVFYAKKSKKWVVRIEVFVLVERVNAKPYFRKNITTAKTFKTKELASNYYMKLKNINN